MKVKLVNENISLVIAVPKYICDIYLSMLDFNGLCKFNNIY